MKDGETGIRIRVLILRSILGIVFALLLMRWFFPTAGVLTIVATAVLLVFFAYLFESIHAGKQ
ncbi:MAG: hypothetical protein KBH99_07710 [Syntrophobacteraceae bacterium]|nr:hypothetical protein [Syntrophobacteraceae bacterium]